MDTAVLAALSTTFGFAVGDVFTAMLARRVSGKASMALMAGLKLLLYLPFAWAVRHEFAALDGYAVAWSLALGALFFVASFGFNLGLQVGKNPALVGVVAGCFPASATVVAIVVLGQLPSLATMGLLLAVLAGVVLIGLPDNWCHSLRPDKGVALALLPFIFWGVFGALLHKPVQHMGTPHAWFVVQVIVAAFLAAGSGVLYNRQLPDMVRQTQRRRAWGLLAAAGLAIGLAEATQAMALGGGRNLVVIEALIGSYPAAYFLMAHHVFRQPLRYRQWAGIILVAIAIIFLSIGGVRA